MAAKTSVLQYVLYWPYVLSIQVVCLEIIRSNPQGVLHVFPIREFSTKCAEHFDFLSIKPQSFVFILPCLLVFACFFGQSRCFRSSVNFFDMMIAFLQRKSTVSLALASISTYFGLCFISPKENTFGPSKPKAATSYPTVHFVSRRTQTFTPQENAQGFLPVCFWNVCLWQFSFVSRLQHFLVRYKKQQKRTCTLCISQRVIT